MLEIEQYQQADGVYFLRPEKILTEETTVYVIETLKSIYRGSEATYIILNLENNYTLPIRKLATDIRSFYRSIPPTNSPMFIAVIVENSMIQVMDSVLKTLMRREAIQAFNEMSRAKQWLMLERLKQQNVKDIGKIMRNDKPD